MPRGFGAALATGLLECRESESGPRYHIIDETTQDPVFWEEFDMTLADIEIWLE